MSIFTWFLVLLGVRSKCCHAEIWDWDFKKSYCSKCDNRV
jgi:hypothetical protein